MSPFLATGLGAALFAAVCVASTGCSTPAPARYSDAPNVQGADTLGTPDEGMPDPTLRKADETAEDGYGASASSGGKGYGWVGIELRAHGSGQAGVAIVEVVHRSPATEAGLRKGDVIVQVDGQAVDDPVTLIKRIRRTKPGTRLPWVIYRDRQQRLLSVQVEPVPDPSELLERRFVGLKAPTLDGLVRVSGDEDPSWAGLRGRIVVLEFWSPWCGVCQLMHQRLNEWQAQWGLYGVTVMGIAALGPEEARAFGVRRGLEYAVAADPSESAFRAYDVFAIPSLFLVDREGVVVDASTGYSSKRLSRMEKALMALIGREPTRSKRPAGDSM